MRICFAIIGKSGAGKETVYNIIKEEIAPYFSSSIHHFSEPLNETLDIFKLPKNRPNQQALSTALRQAPLKREDGSIAGEEILGNTIKLRALEDETDAVFLDGVRRPQDVVMLRNIQHSLLIHVFASPEARFERLKKRADRPGDAEKTWEEFLKEQSAEAESMIDAIAKEADFAIDNSGTLDDLRREIRKFIKKEEKGNAYWLFVVGRICVFKVKPA